MVDGDDETVYVPEVAAMLGVDETSVYRLIAAGELRAAKTDGYRWSLKRSEVEGFVESRRVTPRSTAHP